MHNDNESFIHALACALVVAATIAVLVLGLGIAHAGTVGVMPNKGGGGRK